MLLQVSKAETKANQIAEATSFFERYGDEIQRLRDFPQVENITLKFMAEEAESSREDLLDKFVELVFSYGVTAVGF